VGPGTEEAAVHTAEKEGHQDLIVGYTAFADNHRTDLLVPAVPAVRTVLAVLAAAVRIDLDRIGLRGVGILHNHHLHRQTDLAGHVLVPVPAVHTAVAVGQVGEHQKVGRNRLVRVVHLGVGHIVRIEVLRQCQRLLSR
jgi:hypothetical protein